VVAAAGVRVRPVVALVLLLLVWVRVRVSVLLVWVLVLRLLDLVAREQGSVPLVWVQWAKALALLLRAWALPEDKLLQPAATSRVVAVAAWVASTWVESSSKCCLKI
jgi:hypothetical protein